MLFILSVAAPVFSQDDLPRIAVYVTGNVSDDEKSALGTRMLASLVKSGRYKGIERSSMFLTEVDKELVKQHSGAVDDGQISELGKMFGVKFVCIAAITPAFGTFQVSARIVNVETAEVAFIGESYSMLKSADDLKTVSDEVVRALFGELGGGEKREQETAAYGRPSGEVVDVSTPVIDPALRRQERRAKRPHRWFEVGGKVGYSYFDGELDFIGYGEYGADSSRLVNGFNAAVGGGGFYPISRIFAIGANIEVALVHYGWEYSNSANSLGNDEVVIGFNIYPKLRLGYPKKYADVYYMIGRSGGFGLSGRYNSIGGGVEHRTYEYRFIAKRGYDVSVVDDQWPYDNYLFYLRYFYQLNPKIEIIPEWWLSLYGSPYNLSVGLNYRF